MGINPKMLFRAQALQKVSSPEQLDELIQVTDPTGWLALLALTALIVVALVWSILGSIPSTTVGQGIFIKGGALYGVVAPASGELTEINVAVGDVVTQGQPVARIGSDKIPSPHAGRVAQLLVDQGDYLSVGTTILSLEPENAGMRVTAFVPLADAKKILPGMKAQISPSTIKKEDFGSMLGTVRFVAQFPSTMSGLKGILVNDELIKIVSSIPAPVEVQIELERDPGAPSGYRWTSSGGPSSLQISSGTLGSVTVVTSEQQPISLILPWLKDLLQ